MRLDCFIAKEFQEISRQKASELIKQGQIKVNDNVVTKPSYKIYPHDNVKIEQDFFIESNIYCSRAALKLQRFLSNTDYSSFLFAYCNPLLFNIQSQFLTYLRQNTDIDKWLEWHKFSQKLNNVEYKKDYYKIIQSLVKDAICAIIRDSVILDVGASAGGFTQVLLTYKPKLVVAQDVGKLQLDSILRNRNDVLSIENVDIRDFATNFCNYAPIIASKLQTEENLNKKQTFQFLTCDVSFISLENILKSLCNLSKSMLLLYKPQYEVGLNAKRNKKGVVQDKRIIMRWLESFIALLQNKQATYIFVEKSLLSGKEGNEEFFIFCQF